MTMLSSDPYSYPQLRLQTVWDSGPNNWRLTINYTYTDDGKVDHADYGKGTTTSFGYDGRGMISSVLHKRTGNNQTLASRSYYRDERDRITSFQKGNNPSVNPMEDGRGDHYDYDAEGQLLNAYYGAIDPVTNPHGWVREDHFGFDALGNRSGWNYLASKGWMNFLRRDNGLNQYKSWENNFPDPPQHWGTWVFYDDNISPPDWQYPGNGVTMADGWIVGSYNALNQPKQIGGLGYEGTGTWLWFGYDPVGRCVKHWFAQGDGSSPSAPYFFLYDGWNLVEEGYSPWSPTMVYYHGAGVDEIVASYNTSTNVMAYHYYDGSGHCTMLADWQSNIMEQYYYDAFGYPYFYNGSGGWLGYSPHGNRFLFTGREWIESLKLYDFRNRLYQPELGRFMQPDPKEFGAGDYNLYRYCHNDPINRTDPSGLDDINLIPRDTDKNRHLADYVDKGMISDRAITVGAHGNEYYAVDSNHKELPPEKLAQLVKEVKKESGEPKYKPGMPVILQICCVAEAAKPGSEPYAQKVANALGPGSIVRAPTGDVQRWSDGGVRTDHRESEWKTFRYKRE